MWQCLIIEDDRANARYLAKGLRELGHTVRVPRWRLVCLHLLREYPGRWSHLVAFQRVVKGDVHPRNAVGRGVQTLAGALGTGAGVVRQ